MGTGKTTHQDLRPRSGDRRRGWAWSPRVAALLAIVLGVIGANGVSMERSMGWDEAMHLAVPAAGMAEELAAGDVPGAVRVALTCERYPPFVPAVHAVVGAVLAPTELVMRRTQRWFWALGALGMFLLARALCSREPDDELPPGVGGAPLLAFALWILCPLAIAFGGTLFLEVPFTALATLAVAGWITRARAHRPRIEFLTGLLLAACLFTKWNYGLLLGGGLLLDLVGEGVVRVRRGEGRGFVASVLRLGLPTALACAWWFLLPWPAGAETAASHRAALASFLSGNLGMGVTPVQLRWFDWTTFLVPSPRVLVWVVLAALLACVRLRDRGVRIVLVVLLTSGLPVWRHTMHLDRFLLPSAVFLFVLAASGASRFLARLGRGRVLVGLALLGLGFVAPSADAMAVLHALSLANPDAREYQLAVLAERRSVAFDRVLPTNGLPRAVHDELIQHLDATWTAGARVGWLGLSQAFCPGVWGMGLVGVDPDDVRARELLRAPDLDQRFLTLEQVDPEPAPEEVLAWASGFDVLWATDPPDLTTGRRAWFARERAVLTGAGWTEEEVATLRWVRATGAERAVRLLLLLPPR